MEWNGMELTCTGLFILIMMFDQLAAIFENTPGIDSLQGKKGVQRGKMHSLIEVFGERLSWRWFIPFDVTSELKQQFNIDCNEYSVAPPPPRIKDNMMLNNRYVFDTDQTYKQRQELRYNNMNHMNEHVNEDPSNENNRIHHYYNTENDILLQNNPDTNSKQKS